MIHAHNSFFVFFNFCLQDKHIFYFITLGYVNLSLIIFNKYKTGCSSWYQSHAWDAVSHSPKSSSLRQNSTTTVLKVGCTILTTYLGIDSSIVHSVSALDFNFEQAVGGSILTAGK